ncbi:MAG: hypothetical protein RLZZ330_560 [Actinomycetota bacterium]|jgi:hypothetical protein
MKPPVNTQNVFGRFLFAALITYIATQAHGWAGGVATPYWFTTLTWILVSIVSIKIRSRTLLLVLSIGVQLIIHYGSMLNSSHAYPMNTSGNSMVVGHVIAGIAAWAITILAERPFTSISTAAILFEWQPAFIFGPIKTFNWSFKSFYSIFLNLNHFGRAPPAASSY